MIKSNLNSKLEVDEDMKLVLLPFGDNIKKYYQRQFLIHNVNIVKDVPICCVCLDPLYCSPGNELVECDICKLVVHQECYEYDLKPEIPKDDFFCFRCKQLLMRRTSFDHYKCHLCGRMEGVLFQLEDDQSKDWLHIVCANWITKIHLINYSHKVENYSSLKGKRNRHRCYICGTTFGNMINVYM